MSAERRQGGSGSGKAALRIFVSSTAKDLEEHRAKVLEALLKIEKQPVAMEFFGADPGDPLSVCQEKAASADCVVVIVAHCYGWKPTKKEGGNGQKSITWWEVEAAETAGKPVLAFLVDPEIPWPHGKETDRLRADMSSSEMAEVQQSLQGLKAFKTHLSRRVRAKFSSPDNLATQVVASLFNWREHRGEDEKVVLGGYLEKLLCETAWIEIRGIASAPGASKTAIPHQPIEELYTPLTTCRPLEERQRQVLREPGSERVKLSELLPAHRRLLLVGSPGSGKTTFLKLIAAVLAKDLQGAGPAGDQPGRKLHLGFSLEAPPPVPVFIRLASLGDWLSKNGDPHSADPGTLLSLLEQPFGAAAAKLLGNKLDQGTAFLLLDGLDEVADPLLRERLLQLVDHLLAGPWGKNPVIVTSRPYDYDGVAALKGVETVQIDDFGEAEIREFLGRWVRVLQALQLDQEPGATGYQKQLEDAILLAPAVHQMAKNPVMLTCLAVVHWNERQLPEGKYRLLAAVLRWLLFAKEEKRRQRGYRSRFAEECFKALALAMTADRDGKKAQAGLAWAAEQLARPFRDERGIPDPDRVRALGIEFLENEMFDSGIVERVHPGEVRFWHLTFQEHYAARALAGLGDAEDGWWPIIKPNLFDRQWSETLDHLACRLDEIGRRGTHLLAERILKTAKPDDLESTALAVGVLGRILRILKGEDYQPPAHLGWEETLQRVLGIFTVDGAARVQVEDRIRAARALGQAGDPRFDGIKINMLPIPGMPGVLLGTYPVTVEEYRCFVDSGGYEKPEYWEENWWAKDKYQWNEPGSWSGQEETPNHPVTGVSWFEALAFCRWLSTQTNHSFRLPLDIEWLSAASNEYGPYPWGSEDVSRDLANSQSAFGGTTPVGVFPKGAAPGGHLDLAGNVWEWCIDDVSEEYGYYAESYLSRESPGSLRSLRGGGWRDGSPSLKSDYQAGNPAWYRNDVIGFRVALSVFLEAT